MNPGGFRRETIHPIHHPPTLVEHAHWRLSGEAASTSTVSVVHEEASGDRDVAGGTIDSPVTVNKTSALIYETGTRAFYYNLLADKKGEKFARIHIHADICLQ